MQGVYGIVIRGALSFMVCMVERNSEDVGFSLTDEDKQWIREELERVETSLLTEFHMWASPMEARVRSHSATMRAFDAELESLNDRVSNLEKPPG